MFKCNNLSIYLHFSPTYAIISKEIVPVSGKDMNLSATGYRNAERNREKKEDF